MQKIHGQHSSIGAALKIKRTSDLFDSKVVIVKNTSHTRQTLDSKTLDTTNPNMISIRDDKP